MTTGFLFADEMDLAEKRVLLRLDVNVPIQDGQVSDDTRIRRIIPGLQALVAARAKIIILTHFGRPKGKIVPDLSIRPVADCMAKLLGQAVVVETDVIGAGGAAAVAGSGCRGSKAGLAVAGLSQQRSTPSTMSSM